MPAWCSMALAITSPETSLCRDNITPQPAAGLCAGTQSEDPKRLGNIWAEQTRDYCLRNDDDILHKACWLELLR